MLKLALKKSVIACAIIGLFQIPTAVSEEDLINNPEETILEVLTYSGFQSLVIVHKSSDGQYLLPSKYRVDLNVPDSVPEFEFNGEKYLEVKLIEDEEGYAKLFIDSRYLPTNVISLEKNSELDELRAVDSSFSIDYDLYLSKTNTNTIAAGFLSSKKKIGNGVLRGSLVRTSTENNQENQLIGLNYEAIVSKSHVLTAGEQASLSSEFGSSDRIFGFSLSTAGIKRPDLSPASLTSINGELSSLSDVSVFINGVKLYEEKVKAGKFVLNEIPIEQGISVMTLVVKDITGREVVRQIPLSEGFKSYTPGQFDYSISSGALYQKYGVFGKGYLSGFAQLGLTEASALVLSSEKSEIQESSWVGLRWTPSENVYLSPFAGFFKSDDEKDYSPQFGYRISLRSDFASLGIGSKFTPNKNGFSDSSIKRESQVSLTVPITESILVSASFGSQERAGQPNLELLSSFASMTLKNGWRAGLGSTYVDKEFSFIANLSIPLDSKTISSSTRLGGAQKSITSSYSKDRDPRDYYGTITHTKSFGDFSDENFGFSVFKEDSVSTKYASVFKGQNDSQFTLGMRGNVIYDYSDNKYYRSNITTDAQVLIRDLDSNALVYVNGQEFKNDGKDYMLLPSIPYEIQSVTIDPDSLSPETEMNKFNYLIRPDFLGLNELIIEKPIPGRQVTVLDSSGHPLPLGSLLIFGDEEAVIGDQGKTFLRLKNNIVVEALIPLAPNCKFTYTVEKSSFNCE